MNLLRIFANLAAGTSTDMATGQNVRKIEDAHSSARSLTTSACNLGFEDGDFSCWDTIFTSPYYSQVKTSHGSYAAPYGNYMAVIGGGCYTNKISKQFTVSEIAAISGQALWDGEDYLPFDDYGIVRILEDNTVLFQASIAIYGDNGEDSPWMPFQYMPPVVLGATYTMEVTSTNVNDCGFTSYVLVDLEDTVVNPGGPYLVHVGSEGGQLAGAMTTVRADASTWWSLACHDLSAVGDFQDASSLETTLSFDSVTDPTLCDLTLAALDANGDLLTHSTTTVIVVDSSAGFVTGGGWIQSPEGAFPASPLAIGPANFGFVSKYKKGKSVPSGETKFVFDTVGLHFKSTSYEWLVITGADCAKYKGIGEIQGDAENEYGFMLTACDAGEPGSGDEFRMKIWLTEADTETVVYDNKLGGNDDLYDGTVISGGNIQIHKPKNPKNLRA